MPGFAVLLLAAGASRRMAGRDKHLEPIAGEPLLRERARMVLASGHPVVVTLPPEAQAPARWRALDGLRLTRVVVTDWERGLSASLKAGFAALPPTTLGVVIVLADMPGITAGDISLLIAQHDGRSILRGSDRHARPGHPVLLPRASFGLVEKAEGDRGLGALLARAPNLRLIRLPHAHARTDLDTPEDWAEWRGEVRDTPSADQEKSR